MSFEISLSIDINAKPFRQFSDILDRRNVLISFNSEKVRSADATETGIVSKIFNDVNKLGKVSTRPFLECVLVDQFYC